MRGGRIGVLCFILFVHSYAFITTRIKYESRIYVEPTQQQRESTTFLRDNDWLEKATNKLLDPSTFRVGELRQDDVQSISGLMTAWARRRSVSAAVTVERLLKRVVDEIRAGNPEIYVHTRMYTYAIDAWAKSTVAPARAQSIHDAMVQMYKDTGDDRIAPNIVSYNALLNAWAKSNATDCIQKAEKVLDDIIAAQLKPDAITLSTILDAYSRSNVSNATIQAEYLFELMDKYNVTKNAYSYSALQNVYARSGRPDAIQKTMQILQTMQSNSSLIQPTCINYNAVLLAASRRPSAQTSEFVVSFLEQMESPIEKGGFDVEPDTMSYAFTILAVARSPDPQDAARKAEIVLERMEQRGKYEQEKRIQVSSAAPASVKLDIECYNTVLTCIARSKESSSPARILAIIRRMEELANQGYTQLRPVTRSWNALLNAYARSSSFSDIDVSFEAESILTGMFDSSNMGNSDAGPDEYSFAAVLSTLQRSSRADAHTRADELVRLMEEMFQQDKLASSPDVYHYTILCGTWARSNSRNAVGRCLQILSHMLERHKQGFTDIRPNIRTYNAVMDCLARNGKADVAEELLFYMLKLYRNGDGESAPDIFTFNSVIRAHCKSGRKDAGQRAETMLERLLEYCQEENPKVQPSVKSFAILITYYRNSRDMDAPYRAEYVLSRLCSLYKSGASWLMPETSLFSMVVESYAHSKHPDAGTNADRFLRTMISLKENYYAKDLRISRYFMNRVLFAWANSGDANAGSRCEKHLEWMEERCNEKDTTLCPDSQSYRLTLTALAKSSSQYKVEKCLQILDRMKASPRASVDEYCYSIVINACAFSNGGHEQQAFETAVMVLKLLLESDKMKPSALSFGWFIQACGRLTSVPEESRNKELIRAFQLCCNTGLVNGFVIQRLRGAASKDTLRYLLEPALGTELFAEMLGSPKKSILRNLPEKWRRHVK